MTETLVKVSALLLLWVCGLAWPDIPDRFVGDWTTVVEEQPGFPVWWEMKYPVTFSVTKETLSFKDQVTAHIDSNCEPPFFFDTELDALIFQGCGSTKSERAIPGFHRVFTDGNRLVGEVWQHKLMFRWRGTRVDAEKAHGQWRLRRIEAVPAWFEDHKALLFEVRDLLLSHVDISVVRPDKPIGRSTGLSAAGEAAHAEVSATLKRLGIPEVRVSRTNGSSHSIQFVLWRHGVGASEHAIVLHYRVSKDVSLKQRNSVHPQAYTVLPVPGWFAYRTW